MFNMQKMLKQVQKLQEEMVRVQAELAGERIEASSGGGVVRAVATGQGDLVEIAIDPSVVDPSDVAMLQDLILAAAGEALRAQLEQRRVLRGSGLVESATALAGDVVVARIAGTSVQGLLQALRARLDAIPALLGDDPWARRA